MHWIFITAVPDIAAHADRAGVEQVMVDLEHIGKDQRQGHVDTHKSVATVAEVPGVAAALTDAELMVRINPLGPHSRTEIQTVLASGAQRLMLPMFRDAREVATFRNLVGMRVPITLLVETPAALAGIQSYLPLLAQTDRIHFGLNDLTLAMGYHFVFEPLARGDIDMAAMACRDAGIAFGIGGGGRAGQGDVTPHRNHGEPVRRGASWAIQSRAVRGWAPQAAALQSEMDMKLELEKLRDIEMMHRSEGPTALEQNRKAFIETVERVAHARALA